MKELNRIVTDLLKEQPEATVRDFFPFVAEIERDILRTEKSLTKNFTILKASGDRIFYR